MVTKLYFPIGQSLVLLERMQSEWRLTEYPTNWKLMCVQVDPKTPERIYVGTFDHGLKISDDGGKTWKDAGEGISSKRIMSLAISPTEINGNYHVLWAGTEPSQLYRSEDGGRTWTSFPRLLDLSSRSTWRFPPRPYTHHIQSIQPDLHDPEKIFVGIELGGVMRSKDQGFTWEDRKPNSQYDCHNLAMTKEAPGYLFEAAGGGFAFTTDGGDIWETFNDGLGTFTYLYDIAVCSKDQETMVASAAESARTAYDPSRAKTVIFRRENGKAWERVEQGLPKPEGSSIFSLIASEKEADTFYAVNNRGVFYSTDGGLHWEKISSKWPDHFQTKRVRGFVAIYR